MGLVEIAAPSPPIERPTKAPVLTMDRVWALLAVGAPMFGVLLATMWTIDLAYHVRAGLTMLDTHQVIRTDTWSFTVHGRPWLDQQWGAQVLLALVYRLGGWAGVSILRALLTGGTFLLVLLACREYGASLRASAGLSIAACIVSLDHLQMRPQSFAILLFAATLWILARRRRHPKVLWLMPVLVAAWANIHGSFILAPLLLGFAWIEDMHDRDPGATRTLLVGITSVAATVVSPFGPRVWVYAFDIATNPTIRNTISEWEPPTIRSYAGIAFLVSVAAVAAYFGRRTEHVPWLTLLKLGVFFALALPALRGVVWWALLMPVAIAEIMPPPDPKKAERVGSPLLNFAVVSVLLAGTVAALPWWRGAAPDGSPRILREAPASLVAAVRQSAPAGSRLFASQTLGSWLEFALPQDQIFVDSRIEIYPAAVWNDYQSASSAREGWQAILDRWRVEAAVLNEDQSGPLIDAMQGDGEWKLVFHDQNGYVFVRAGNA